MEYQLAKQLKDAGFSFKKTEAEVTREPMVVDGEDVYTPTLSELIEACGDKLTLTRFGDDYNAYDSDQIDGEYGSYNKWASGTTPEEAVAKLYLALHSPKANVT